MPDSNKVIEIEKDVARIQVVLDRIDESVEKLTSISADVTQLLAVREVRFTASEKKLEELDGQVDEIRSLPPMAAGEIYDLVEKTRKEFVEELEELKNELLTKNNDNATKISTIEKYMWISMGIATAMAILSSKLGAAVASILQFL